MTRRLAFPLAAGGLVLLGVALRVLSMLAFRPAILGNNDGVGYLDASRLGIFRDPVRPAGYPLFLRAVRWLSDSLTVTIALQHALGIATAGLLYLTVRRVGGSRWAGLLPAAVVLLLAEFLYLEHALMSESVFAFLLACGAYAAARAVTGEGLLWPALVAACFAGATTVRTVAVLTVPLAIAWAALFLPAPARRRLAAGGMAAAMALAVAVVYAVPQKDSVGSVGLGRAGGWSLYGRAAPFADCSEFTPPAGTEQLCEQSDPDERRGGNWYAWRESPARSLYGGPPQQDEIVGRFGRAAIEGQPLDYLEAVATDLIRYAAPGFNARPDSGLLPDTTRFPYSDPVAVPQVQAQARPLYGPTRPQTGPGRRLLERWSGVVALHPALIGLLVVAGSAAMLLTRGAQRRLTVLLTAASLAMLALPALIAEYSHRYAVPVAPLLAVGAALLLDARLRRGAPAPAPREPAAAA